MRIIKTKQDIVILHRAEVLSEALSQFHKLLEDSPPETKKTLLQTVVKQIHMKDRRKVAGIELELDPTVQKHFFELAPSAKTAEGAFAFRKQKSPSRYCIVFDLKKLAEAR